MKSFHDSIVLNVQHSTMLGSFGLSQIYSYHDILSVEVRSGCIAVLTQSRLCSPSAAHLSVIAAGLPLEEGREARERE